MGKLIRRAGALLGAMLISASPMPAFAVDATVTATPAPKPAPAVSKYAAILVDAGNREVLYANGADLIRHPASITKIMTLFIAFDEIDAGRLKLTYRVPISRFAASQRPSKLGLAP